MNAILHQKRNINYFIALGLTIALVVIAVFAIATSATMMTNGASNVPQNITGNKGNAAILPLAADAFPQYRQSEWHSSAISLTGVSGLEIYRQSEQTLIPAEAGLMAYHLSERTLVNPLAEYLASERTLSPIVSTDFSSYHLSERTMTEPIAIIDLSQYLASERTLVDPMAGLSTYFESERGSIPVQFTQYQLSEWFGR